MLSGPTGTAADRRRTGFLISWASASKASRSSGKIGSQESDRGVKIKDKACGDHDISYKCRCVNDIDNEMYFRVSKYRFRVE